LGSVWPQHEAGCRFCDSLCETDLRSHQPMSSAEPLRAPQYHTPPQIGQAGARLR